MTAGKAKFYIKEYFTFSKGEKVGVLVFISLIVIVFTLFLLTPRFFSNHSNSNVSDFNNAISQFEKSSDSLKVVKGNDVEYKPHIDTKKTQDSKKSTFLVDLNKADSSSLDRLPGIGPVFSKRIIKYRTILGGYYSINQLNEVYGIKPDLVESITKFLIVDTTQIEKLDLNSSDFKKINAHPYISFEQTKAICNYRVRNKIFSLKQLENLNIFSSAELLKIRPYVLFGD